MNTSIINEYTFHSGCSPWSEIIKTHTLERILVDYPAFSPAEPDFTFVTLVLFEFGTENLLLLQNQIKDDRQDDDEYPSLYLSVTNRDILQRKHSIMKKVDNRFVFDHFEDCKWHIFNVKQRIENVALYRDHALWEYNGRRWDSTIDTAFMVTGEAFNFLCILQDDISGAMAVHFDVSQDPSVFIDRYWSKEKWGMKSEHVHSLQREKITIA